MQKDLISIIIPVYNVEDYLNRCLDSVINQTYKNLEIILIDDGSNDNSGKICDQYAKKDERIRVIHQDNKGLSGARNKGLDIASGKYISFIDSDDYVSSHMIQILYDELIKNNCDISIARYKVTSNNYENVDNFNYQITILDQQKTLKELLLAKKFDVSACSKLYKKSVINNVRFPLNKLCEDNGTTYKFIMNSKNTVFLNKELYFYYKRSNSIMTSNFNEKKLDLIELVDSMSKDILNKYPNLKKYTIKKQINARFSILKQISVSSNNRYNGTYNDIKKSIMKYKYWIIFKQIFSVRERIACILLMLSDDLFRKVCIKKYK